MVENDPPYFDIPHDDSDGGFGVVLQYFECSDASFLPFLFEPIEFDFKLSYFGFLFFSIRVLDDGKIHNFPVAEDERIDVLFFLLRLGVNFLAVVRQFLLFHNNIA